MKKIKFLLKLSKLHIGSLSFSYLHNDGDENLDTASEFFSSDGFDSLCSCFNIFASALLIFFFPYVVVDISTFDSKIKSSRSFNSC